MVPVRESGRADFNGDGFADQSGLKVASRWDSPSRDPSLISHAYWMDVADADLVSLADTMIEAHGRGVSWDDVKKILAENFSESDAEIYGELVVVHLMKDVPEDDAWKVAAAAERRAREAKQAPKPRPEPEPKPEPKPEPEPEPSETEPAMTASQEQAVGKAESYLDYTHFSRRA